NIVLMNVSCRDTCYVEIIHLYYQSNVPTERITAIQHFIFYRPDIPNGMNLNLFILLIAKINIPIGISHR
ncbi:hypothetical protein, partial [Flavobacterium nitrogenifigens]|uniref:hypothetical protein n=1 Tax=Flavobacterium nitrogenifigens TaxID=1617283 RepID=UPI00194EAA0C